VRGEHDDDDDDDEGEVDFVTGQRRMVGETGGEEGLAMSEEEKMREAERLFVLFERWVFHAFLFFCCSRALKVR